MSLRIVIGSAVPAIYIVVSLALLLTRNARALRALERFAPAGSGRGWGHADVELGGMRCEIRWASWWAGRLAVSRWTSFRFQTATTGELTITPREFRLAARLRELVQGPRVDLGDEAFQAKFTVYGGSEAFARRVLTKEARGLLLGLERLGPVLAVSAGEVRLEIEASPITPGAPLPPDQLVRCLEEGHRLALSVARAGSEAKADDEASRASDPPPGRREPHARPAETGRILMLAALLAILGLVVVTTLAPGLLAGSHVRRAPVPLDPAPANHR
jgi:hypothetical protein